MIRKSQEGTVAVKSSKRAAKDAIAGPGTQRKDGEITEMAIKRFRRELPEIYQKYVSACFSNCQEMDWMSAHSELMLATATLATVDYEPPLDKNSMAVVRYINSAIAMDAHLRPTNLSSSESAHYVRKKLGDNTPESPEGIARALINWYNPRKTR